MHDKPAHPWTLDKLAAESGASRASLACRFHDLVGEPPMTFLKNWRMAMAADLLCQPDETAGTVTQKVGYSTPFAVSEAVNSQSPSACLYRFEKRRIVAPQLLCAANLHAIAIEQHNPRCVIELSVGKSLVPHAGHSDPTSPSTIDHDQPNDARRFQAEFGGQFT